jgi:hypothetical protein
MSTKELALVNFEQAKRLKKSGFDWETLELYHEDGTADIWTFDNHNVISYRFSAPTVPLALKWFRDRKGLFGNIDFAIANFRKGYYYNYFSFSDKNITGKTEEFFGEYEAAESALLDELLSIFEKEQEQ